MQRNNCTAKSYTATVVCVMIWIGLMFALPQNLPAQQTLIGWDFDGNSGDEKTVAATTVDASLYVPVIKRGEGISENSLADSFNSSSYTADGDKSDALTNGEFIEFSIKIGEGGIFSLEEIDTRFRRSGTGPNTFQWQYSLDGFDVDVNDIGSEIIYEEDGGNGHDQSLIDLTGISQLQNVDDETTVTFRLYGWGASSSAGTFAIGRRTGDDFFINGTIEETGTPIADKPQVDPAPGPYRDEVEIELSTDIPDATIYYSTDSTDLPSEESQAQSHASVYEFTAPITLTETATLKARTYRENYQTSEQVEEEYFITDQLVIYEFTNESVEPSASDDDITVSDFLISSGSVSFGESHSATWEGSGVPYAQGNSGWSKSSAGEGKYFYFTLEPESGYQFTPMELSFQYRATGAGPSAMTLVVIKDSQEFEIETVDVLEDETLYHKFDLTNGYSELVDVEEQLEFRIIGWDNESRETSGGGAFRLNDVGLGGAVDEIEEILSHNIMGSAGWRMLSFPVDDVKVSDLAAQNQVQGITGANDFYDGMENLDNIGSNLLYYLDDDDWQNPANFDHQFESGQGVIWYMYDNDEGVSVELPFELSVSGTSPKADVTVSRNISGDFTLIGNPFAVDLNTSDVSTWGDIQATARTWDPDTEEYIEINNAEAFSGFFVEKAESATEENITIPNPQTARSTGGAERKIALHLKGTNAEGVTLTDQSSSVRFIEGAKDDWDIYDATKLTPLNTAYATIGFVGKRGEEERIKSIDSRPVDVEGTIEIPLALSTFNFGGDFELSADLVNVPEGWSVILTDHHTGVESDLISETYSFEYATEKSKALKAVKKMQPERFTMDASESESERFVLTITPDEATTADSGADLPQKLTLNPNYPNPFNPVTTISYKLPEDARVELAVYDLMGRRVITLVDEQQRAGIHEAAWDASGMASGTYMYRLTIDNREVLTRTMTLLK